MLAATISLITNTLAVLCLIAIPLWALGVPGELAAGTPYVQGWKMGFGVIISNPLAIVVNNWVPWDPVKRRFAAVFILATAVLLMIWAFKLILQE